MAILTGLGVLTSSMLLLFGGTMPEVRVQTLPAGIMIAGLVAVGLWLRGLRKLKVARLIILFRQFFKLILFPQGAKGIKHGDGSPV